MFKNPVAESAFPVVDMRDDAEVSNVFLIEGHMRSDYILKASFFVESV